jgi:hypothetical protein
MIIGVIDVDKAMANEMHYLVLVSRLDFQVKISFILH